MRSGKQGGFTLLELSVVLIIIGVVTSIGVSSGITALESAKRAQTTSKLNVIESALQIFRVQNNRLPCPSNILLQRGRTGYGAETGIPGSCAGSNYGTTGEVVEGGVPTQALNIPDDFAFDGWGRKIGYAVDSRATNIEAFNAIAIPESCGISVNDASGSARTSSAIYALISYGSNGHGGYLANGMRMATQSLDQATLANCHCNSDASATTYQPVYIQKEVFENPNDDTLSFTGIVRYKERWQLVTSEDQTSFALGGSYRGPNLTVGFDVGAAGSDSAYTYKLQCGRLVKQPALDPQLQGATTGIVYTPDNRYLITFSQTGCTVYSITDDVVGTGSGTSIPGCPAYSPLVKVDMSSNGYLGMISPVAPYIYLWEKSGASFVPMITPTPGPVGVVTQISVTPNYLLLADNSSMLIYGRSANSYTGLATQPAGVPGSIYSALISPNENFLAVTVDGNVAGTPPPQIYFWRIDTGPVFTALSTLNIAQNDTPNGMTFSPDGDYFVVGGTSGNNLNIYKITDSSFSPLPLPDDWVNSSDTAGISFSFSKDSRYLAMGTASSSKPLALFRRISAVQYKVMTIPTAPDIQNNPAFAVKFNN